MTTVVAIEPCPQLAAGEGRVVLTTVNHLNNDVWQLTAESRSGRREQLQPTGLHKFYSETRRDWVSTKEIHAGEVIRGRAGPLTLVDAHPLPGTRRVYNLTVEGEHVYYVSELGLLAHNMDCGGAGQRLVPGTQGVVTGGSSTALGKNILEAIGLPRNTPRRGTQAQHLIPSELASHPTLTRLGIDLDDAGNGILLPSANSKTGVSILPRHTGSHPAYTNAVRRYLDDLNSVTDLSLLDQGVFNLQQNLRNIIYSGVPVRNVDGATSDLWYRLLTQNQ